MDLFHYISLIFCFSTSGLLAILTRKAFRNHPLATANQRHRIPLRLRRLILLHLPQMAVLDEFRPDDIPGSLCHYSRGVGSGLGRHWGQKEDVGSGGALCL